MDTRNDNQDDPQGRIDAEAADWWSRLELGNADRAAFNQWRDANPAHAVAYARLQATWESLLEEEPATGEVEAEAGEAAMSRRRLLRNLGVGAAALAVGGVFATSRAMAWDRARTGVGELRRITLPDASVLELNTDTAVAWRFTARAREIRLEQGEIAVALLAGAPATLIAELTRLALSAGQFNVRLTGAKIGLTVLRGDVVAAPVSAPAAGGSVHPTPLHVATAQAVDLGPTAAKVQAISVEDRAIATAWQSGDILFQNERLQTAVDEYNRYLTRKIVVDPDLRDLRVGGRFTTADPTSFLKAVAFGLDVGVRTTSDSYRISKN